MLVLRTRNARPESRTILVLSLSKDGSGFINEDKPQTFIRGGTPFSASAGPAISVRLTGRRSRLLTAVSCSTSITASTRTSSLSPISSRACQNRSPNSLTGRSAGNRRPLRSPRPTKPFRGSSARYFPASTFSSMKSFCAFRASNGWKRLNTGEFRPVRIAGE
jgi:hypothetical protein